MLGARKYIFLTLLNSTGDKIQVSGIPQSRPTFLNSPLATTDMVPYFSCLGQVSLILLILSS